MHARRISSSPSAVVLLGYLLLASLSACASASSPRHLRIVNATFDGLTELAFAPSGSTDFQSVPLGSALPGGVSSVIVSLPPGSCHRDVRFSFGERALIYPNVDVCRNDGLKLAAGAAPGHGTLLRGDLQSAGSP